MEPVRQEPGIALGYDHHAQVDRDRPVQAFRPDEWEAPDPGFWCQHGYAVANPDARGACRSEGDIAFFGEQEGRDGHDFVEWLAGQQWCNGKVGLSGNSWLAQCQWFIAAEQPPHLAAIAPWEGLSDIYRDLIMRGGIPDYPFCKQVMDLNFTGHQGTEDMIQEAEQYPADGAAVGDEDPEVRPDRRPGLQVPGHERGVPRASVTDIDTQQIRRKPVSTA